MLYSQHIMPRFRGSLSLKTSCWGATVARSYLFTSLSHRLLRDIWLAMAMVGIRMLDLIDFWAGPAELSNVLYSQASLQITTPSPKPCDHPMCFPLPLMTQAVPDAVSPSTFSVVPTASTPSWLLPGYSDGLNVFPLGQGCPTPTWVSDAAGGKTLPSSPQTGLVMSRIHSYM